MNLTECIAQLDQNAQSIQQLLSGISPKQAAWQPDPASWSATTLMEHLYDEERTDFRARLAAGLGLPDPSQPQEDVPYKPDDLPAILAAFMDERARSVAWLRGLDSPDWAAMCDIYGGDQISAGDMVVSWVAHDVLHMRQVIAVLYAYVVHSAQPYSVRYAGEW